MRIALLLAALVLAPAAAAQIGVAVAPHVGLQLAERSSFEASPTTLLGLGVELRLPDVPGATLDPVLVPFGELVLGGNSDLSSGTLRRSRAGVHVGVQLRGKPGWTVRPRLSVGVERQATRISYEDRASNRYAEWSTSAALGLHSSRVGVEVSKSAEDRGRLRLIARLGVR